MQPAQGSFHGFGRKQALLIFNKKLGGKAEHLAFGRFNKGPVTNRLARTKPGIKRKGMTKALSAKLEGVVDLVGVALGDVGLNGGNVAGVVVFAKTSAYIKKACGALVLRQCAYARLKPFNHLLIASPFALAKGEGFKQ